MHEVGAKYPKKNYFILFLKTLIKYIHCCYISDSLIVSEEINRNERLIPAVTQCLYGTNWSDLSITLNLSAVLSYDTMHALLPVSNSRLIY